MRKLVLWLSVGVVFAAVLAFGALVLGLALVAAPVLLLAARLLGVRSKRRTATSVRSTRGSVYEGEFRVLDETHVGRPS